MSFQVFINLECAATDIRFLKMKSDAISRFIIIIVNNTKTQVQYIIYTFYCLLS